MIASVSSTPTHPWRRGLAVASAVALAVAGLAVSPAAAAPEPALADVSWSVKEINTTRDSFAAAPATTAALQASATLADDGTTPASHDVWLNDYSLHRCIAQAVGWPEDSAIPSDATHGVTYLSCTSMYYWDPYFGDWYASDPVYDLGGIEQFDWSNLQTLALAYNQVTDLSPLAGLNAPNLSALDLASNSISDITPLASLTSLRSVYLDNNQISDISPLAALTHLGEWTPLSGATISVSNNRITDLSPLGKLPAVVSEQADVYAYGQWLQLSLLVGEIPLQVVDLDGTVLDLKTDSTDVKVYPEKGTIAVPHPGVIYLSWGDIGQPYPVPELDGDTAASIATYTSFSGSIVLTVRRETAWQPALPTRDPLVNQADVLVVTGGADENWVSDAEVTSWLDGAAAIWSAETDLKFGFKPTIKRTTMTADECWADLAFERAYAIFGTSWDDYANGTRDLLIFTDVMTCNIEPGTLGATYTVPPEPDLGHGGIIVMSIYPEEAEAADTATVLAHELGHTYSIGHSNLLDCSSAHYIGYNWDERAADWYYCWTAYYGDAWSLMGQGGSHLNGANLYQFGLIRDGDGAAVLQKPGEYTVTLSNVAGRDGTRAALAFSPTAAPSAPVYEETVEGYGYSIEFRNSELEWLGEDAEAGVYVLAGDFAGPDFLTTTLIQPMGALGIETLKPGETLTSATGEIEITVLKQTADSATVSIKIVEGPVLDGEVYMDGDTSSIGQRLYATTWWNSYPDSETFQWYRDSEPIKSATAASYRTTSADQGHILSVAVTGSLTGYAPSTIRSEGAWIAWEWATISPEPVPADGVSAHTVTIELRDAKNQPLDGYGASIGVWVFDGYTYTGKYGADPVPGQPGFYTTTVTSLVPGYLSVEVDRPVGDTAYLTAEFLPDPDQDDIRFTPSARVTNGWNSIRAFFPVTDDSGTPLVGALVQYWSDDPYAQLSSSEVWTDQYGLAWVDIAYWDPEWNLERGYCRAVKLGLATPSGDKTGVFQVCPAMWAAVSYPMATAPADGVTRLDVYAAVLDDWGWVIEDIPADEIELIAPGATILEWGASEYPGEAHGYLVSTTPGTVWVQSKWRDLVSDPVAYEFTPYDGPIPDRITVTPSATTIPGSGGEVTLTVDATVDWKLDFADSWLSVSQDQGKAGVTVVTVKAGANNGTAAREGKVSFSAGSAGDGVTLTQDPASGNWWDDVFERLRIILQMLADLIARLLAAI
jgi:hypothetical protein